MNWNSLKRDFPSTMGTGSWPSGPSNGV